MRPLYLIVALFSLPVAAEEASRWIEAPKPLKLLDVKTSLALRVAPEFKPTSLQLPGGTKVIRLTASAGLEEITCEIKPSPASISLRNLSMESSGEPGWFIVANTPKAGRFSKIVVDTGGFGEPGNAMLSGPNVVLQFHEQSTPKAFRDLKSMECVKNGLKYEFYEDVATNDISAERLRCLFKVMAWVPAESADNPKLECDLGKDVRRKIEYDPK